jgi:hypothetical protein
MEISIKGMNPIELDNFNTNIMESSVSDFYSTNRDHKSKLENKIMRKKPKDVLGLISNLNELFLFEKKVPYFSNKTESWL